MEHMMKRRYTTSPSLLENKVRTLPIAPGIEAQFSARKNITERVERRLNHVWYHLYRIMNDIQLRKIASCNPQAREETEMLTEYAKRALYLLTRNEKVAHFPKDEQQMNTIEDEARKLSTELGKIAFLDDGQSKAKTKFGDTAGQNSHASKYRRWVLEACGLKDDHCMQTTNNNSFSKKAISRRLTMANLNSAENKLARLAPLKGKLSLISSNKRVSGFYQTSGLEDMKAGSLFREDFFLTSTDMLENRPTMAKTAAPPSPEKSLKKEEEESMMPYTRHAESVGRVDNEKSVEIARINGLLRESKQKFMRCIYGHKKSLSPALKDKIIKVNSKELYRYLLEQKKALRIVKGNSRNAQMRFCKTLPVVRAEVSQSDFSVGKVLKMFPLKKESPIKARNKLAMQKTKHTKMADQLINKCATFQNNTETDLFSIGTMERRLKSDLHLLESQVKDRYNYRNEVSDAEKEQEMKFLAQHKHLFIYGKKGMGRFLNANGRDLVKVSDLMMKMNPKYPFLRDRLSEIIVRSPFQYDCMEWKCACKVYLLY
eukprot:TRINITY_DN107349_c0_g1_i1.p1 TRINITY_DN107349_c0_g1~~TRINITY_DN107349_c0_g1_i1.p1  ORF type:complete len:543 (+),score=58.78 TRINITY_DN107349_c0_g1_i1:95-1723(+)